ncbi:MAG: hypothetical protein N3A66_12400, partial [Planctomycetota bacterium]|nr:hypothetical protein [Planctomycetota bacterium]
MTNDVVHDERVHNHGWAASLGLRSFAGWRLISSEGEPVGVLALFSTNVLTADDEVLIESYAAIASQVVSAGMAEEALKEAKEAAEIANQAK